MCFVKDKCKTAAYFSLSFGITTLANLPNPVLTPYTTKITTL